MKTRSWSALFLFLYLGLTGCTRPTTPSTDPPREGSVSRPGSPLPERKSGPATQSLSWPRTLTDSRGKTITLDKSPARIVSLAPSNTELLYALGGGDQLVGDTSACDYPPEAKSKTHVTGALGQIDIEKVQVLTPDLVLAVNAINKKAIEQLENASIKVLTVDPKDVATTYDAIRLIGSAVGHEEQAEKISRELKTRIQAVADKTQGLPEDKKPKVLIAYGDNPIYTTGPGSFIDDIIHVAGGKNIVTAPLPGDTISAEKVVLLQPDVILCDKALAEKLKRIPGWATGVPAIKKSRFFETSPNATLVRPSPRLAQAAEELSAFLHPVLPAGSGSNTKIKSPSAPMEKGSQ